jgi:HD-GYP domain-containing protein (c-di-GMP phosphodiesterase class II)
VQVSPQQYAIVERLSEVGIALSGDADATALLELILLAAKDIIGCDGGTIYSVVEDRELRFEIIRNDSLGIAMGGRQGVAITFPPVPLHDASGQPNTSSVVAYAVLLDVTINIPDAYNAQGFDFSGTRAFETRNGYRSQSFLTVPMKNHEGQIIGVLQLINAIDQASGGIIAFDDWQQRLAESLASQAATALTRNQLIDDMRELFEALIKLIAQAIDDKSPYTGGHCRRVPELTLMLADACVADSGPLAGFQMSARDRYELTIASWLHDCGKITTPDYVMDKATKLAGMNDLIEAVEARFALLERDAEIAMLRALAAGAEPTREQEAFERRRRELRDDLAFLRLSNLGGEFMSDDDIARVRRLAAQCWIDADGHERRLLDAEEEENLCIRRGTLNQRERRIIEGHMDATLKMLESLPYPRHLLQVPEYACGHHEHMDGSGYPRGLTREQMSIPARVMGIADIFEALTASDRPYKRPMPLSQALAILGRMAEGGHVDPDIFAVFVHSGVWRSYAEQFLRSDQIDQVDISALPGLG